MKAQWINLDTFKHKYTGEKTGILCMRRRLYRVKIHDCRFQDPFGKVWVTKDPQGISDGGTIPFPVNRILGRTEYMPAFWWHDNGIRHGGLYEITDSDAIWTPMKRRELDIRLHWGIAATPGVDRGDPLIAYVGASIGTMFSRKKRKQEKER